MTLQKRLIQRTPAGEPPVPLLDGVTLTATVPDSATWALFVVGFGVVGITARRRRIIGVA